jgi:hypothetical protein
VNNIAHFIYLLFVTVSDLTRSLPDETTAIKTKANVNDATTTTNLCNTHVHALNMIERYLRIVCHVTLHCDANASFLTTHCNGALLKACARSVFCHVFCCLSDGQFY